MAGPTITPRSPPTPRWVRLSVMWISSHRARRWYLPGPRVLRGRQQSFRSGYRRRQLEAVPRQRNQPSGRSGLRLGRATAAGLPDPDPRPGQVRPDVLGGSGQERKPDRCRGRDARPEWGAGHSQSLDPEWQGRSEPAGSRRPGLPQLDPGRDRSTPPAADPSWSTPTATTSPVKSMCRATPGTPPPGGKPPPPCRPGLAVNGSAPPGPATTGRLPPTASAPRAGPPRAGPPRAGATLTGIPRVGPPRAGATLSGIPRAGPPRAGPPRAGLLRTGPSRCAVLWAPRRSRGS